MKYVFVVLLVMGLVVPTSFAAGGYFDDLSLYSLLKSIDNSDIVAIGTVSLLTGVYRENLLGPKKHCICTDVLVRLDTMIKGEPNFGPNYIKFMVLGGTAYVPHKEEVMGMWVSTQATFEVGEKVFIMLTNDQNTTYYANYPYGKNRLIYDDYGKRLIKEDKVEFWYKKEDKVKPMQLSLDVAKNLGKAFIEDKAAALLLENQIKNVASNTDENSLTLAQKSTLIDSSKRLFEKEKTK
ncbi:MAG: hypothetical protein OXP71_03950 [Candidatus Poribacteria bacterium]|nr:hypothetical protein [Candidatus Poribacteria bacterium]